MSARKLLSHRCHCVYW